MSPVTTLDSIEGVEKLWCEQCGSKGVRHKKGCPVLEEIPKTAEEIVEEVKEIKDRCPICGGSLEKFVVGGGVRFCSDICMKKKFE